MYRVTCWDGYQLVNILIHDFKNFDLVLRYLGYVPDSEHFIKIKYFTFDDIYEKSIEEILK